MDSRDIVIRPIITERGSDSMSIGRYTFEVYIGANKNQIKKAVEDLFKVHVMDVNTMVIKGKFRGIGRLKGKRLEESGCFSS